MAEQLSGAVASIQANSQIAAPLSIYSMAGRESIIDLTFASPELARDAAWQVSDIYTHSDHKAVITELLSRTVTRRTQSARHVGYKVNTLNREALLSSVQAITATGDANGCAQGIADCIKAACEAAMAKRYSGGSRRKPVPWWNQDISKARAECCAAKRRLQRSRGRASFENNLSDLRSKRKILRNLIIESKSRCFQELCDAADADPFGAAYRMVMGKLDKQPMPTCATTLEAIVRHLFPQQPPLNAVVHLPNTAEAIALTTVSEVLAIAAKIKPGKAPGPDGIPNAVLKTIIAAHPDAFANMYNKCLTDRTIPLRWKKQKLVLIPKPGKKLEDPSSYRPLCMLDTTGKIMVKIICNRLESEIENRCGLSDHQYMLVDIACRAIEGHGCFRAYLHRFKHAESPYCDHCRGDVVDDAEHAFFECPLFESLRRRMWIDGHQLIADNIIDYMLQKEENWSAFPTAILPERLTEKSTGTLSRIVCAHLSLLAHLESAVANLGFESRHLKGFRILSSQTNTALTVPILAARAAGNTDGNDEQNDAQAFATSKKMTRTPPSYADAPSSAPPRIAEGVFLFNAAGSKDETPKRGRGIESPKNKNRKTPPKKSKTVTLSSPSTSELMMELGGILGEIIYMVEDKKPAVRHINVDMKNMLKRMKQIQQTVSEHLERDPKDAQHTNGCPKCDSAQHQKTRCASPATITSGKQATKSPKARNTKQAAPSTSRKQDNGSFVSVNSNDSQRLSETESSKWQKVGQRSKQAKKHNYRPDAVMIRCKEKDSY
ncbi:hypothetical protein ACLKA7_001791 [Drosophila subpalustris]